MQRNRITKKVYVESDNHFRQVADRVSIVSITGNLILSVFKLIAGIAAHSNAMISDAVHSASDVFSTVVVMIGIRLASKEADMECVAAIILAMILFMTGLGIGREALKNILSGNYGNLQVPGVLALIAAAISIVSKEAMFWYTKVNAARIDSSALLADAWHHRSDALSSVGALIGIAGARLGFPVMDSAASLVIFLFIMKAAYDIFKDAVNKVVDHSCDEETERQIYDRVMRNEAVMGIDSLHTRIFGNRIYIDIEIAVNGSYTLRKSHQIAEEVHEDIEKNFQKVKHIMVHVNSAQTDE